MKGTILKKPRCTQKTSTEKYSQFHNYLLSFSSKELCSSVITVSNIRLVLRTMNKSVMETISKILNCVKQRNIKLSAVLFKESITSKETQNSTQKGEQFKKGFEFKNTKSQQHRIGRKWSLRIILSHSKIALYLYIFQDRFG